MFITTLVRVQGELINYCKYASVLVGWVKQCLILSYILTLTKVRLEAVEVYLEP